MYIIYNIYIYIYINIYIYIRTFALCPPAHCARCAIERETITQGDNNKRSCTCTRTLSAYVRGRCGSIVLVSVTRICVLC